MNRNYDWNPSTYGTVEWAIALVEHGAVKPSMVGTVLVAEINRLREHLANQQTHPIDSNA